MVQICKQTFDDHADAQENYFDWFSFPLSPFQKHAIHATVTGNHVLVCAPTGNGKSLPAEFAIQFFTRQKKKVIYTSPIKALSNQKFYDFSKKFPEVRIGLLTGDIKINPDADVLIMTAEILQNTLYQKRCTQPALLSFSMDFENELACIVHDEIHSINLPDRGHVWESIFMMTPEHVQHVMLSATLQSPETLAAWVENIHPESKKTVFLTTVKERVVPLQHWSFVTTTQSLFKIIKDKTLESEIRATVDKLVLLQNPQGIFQETNFYRIQKFVDLLETKRVFMKRSHVLNQVSKYMVDNGMLPCACFLLSRKQIEIAAHEVTTVLLEDDSKVPYIVRRDCESILRNKLPNFEEYLALPEYNNIVGLLEKGIGIHHAGMLPILKEIVEIMFAQGYVKLLFCSETFSMGLNMPIKTVIFTDIFKFDGNQFRMLYGHEYNQASGRAGRRGLDTVGHVIHLNNLFKKYSLVEYRGMMKGEPQSLISRFKISNHWLLNQIVAGRRELEEEARKSMVLLEIESHERGLEASLQKSVNDIARLESMLLCGVGILETWRKLEMALEVATQKKRKELLRKKEELFEMHRDLSRDVETFRKIDELRRDMKMFESQKEATQTYLSNQISKRMEFLKTQGLVLEDKEEFLLTERGKKAAHMRETPCYFAHVLDSESWYRLSCMEKIRVLSCFVTGVGVPEEKRVGLESMSSFESFGSIQKLSELATIYEMSEEDSEPTMHFDIANYIVEWSIAEDVVGCRKILNRIGEEKEVSVGDFVKAVLKIVNMVTEMEHVAEGNGDVVALAQWKEIPPRLLKYIVINQSLYV